MTEQPITRTERLELVKITSQRTRLARQDVEARQAQILADAEAALAARFREQDAAWREVTEEARRYFAEIQEKINARCEELGIPVSFRPGYALGWLDRGENASPSRRAELRKKVQTQAEASARAAKLEIERQSVQVKESIMAGSFVSAEAKELLGSIPSPAELMPAIELPPAIGGGGTR